MNTVEYQQVLGRKVAQERRRHGLSQPELAAMVDRPVAWVSQLERGVQPIDRLSVLQNLADALELPLAELAGETGEDGPPAASRPAAAKALRVVLAGAHSLQAMLGDATPPPLAVLKERTEKACALARAERYDELAKVLGYLLPGLEVAVRAAPPGQQPDICELTAISYQACAAALARLGEPMASWIAADRATDRGRASREPAARRRHLLPAGVGVPGCPPAVPGRGDGAHGAAGARQPGRAGRPGRAVAVRRPDAGAGGRGGQERPPLGRLRAPGQGQGAGGSAGLPAPGGHAGVRPAARRPVRDRRQRRPRRRRARAADRGVARPGRAAAGPAGRAC